MTTYSPSLRLWEGVPGDPAIRNAWGTPLNENMVLLEAAVTDLVSVDLSTATPFGPVFRYTLTTANGAPDQARPLIQNYTGLLLGTCQVQLPNVPKFGWMINNTTGGEQVTLYAGTFGSGTQAFAFPDGNWYPYWCDGAGNIINVPLSLAFLGTIPNLSVGTLTVGTVNASGTVAANALTSATPGTTGNHVVNATQFAATISGLNISQKLPGARIAAGTATTDGTGGAVVTFPTPFATATYAVIPVSAQADVVVNLDGSPNTSFFQVAALQLGTFTPISAPFYWMAFGV